MGLLDWNKGDRERKGGGEGSKDCNLFYLETKGEFSTPFSSSLFLFMVKENRT